MQDNKEELPKRSVQLRNSTENASYLFKMTCNFVKAVMSQILLPIYNADKHITLV